MLEVLFLSVGVWDLVFGDSLWRVVSGLISGEVLGVCIRVAIGLVISLRLSFDGVWCGWLLLFDGISM